jgi:RNA-directed DNA polymerase
MAKGGSKLRSQAGNSRRTPVNTAAPWPDLEEAESRVLHIQAKLHRWATGDPDRRFDDLYNLVCDPACCWLRGPGSGGTKGHGRPGSTG